MNTKHYRHDTPVTRVPRNFTVLVKVTITQGQFWLSRVLPTVALLSDHGADLDLEVYLPFSGSLS